MQLVEFDTDQSQKIWINPAHAATLKTMPNSATTIIYIAGAANISVKGTLDAVAKKLNDGLKA